MVFVNNKNIYDKTKKTMAAKFYHPIFLWASCSLLNPGRVKFESSTIFSCDMNVKQTTQNVSEPYKICGVLVDFRLINHSKILKFQIQLCIKHWKIILRMYKKLSFFVTVVPQKNSWTTSKEKLNSTWWVFSAVVEVLPKQFWFFIFIFILQTTSKNINEKQWKWNEIL